MRCCCCGGGDDEEPPAGACIGDVGGGCAKRDIVARLTEGLAGGGG